MADQLDILRERLQGDMPGNQDDLLPRHSLQWLGILLSAVVVGVLTGLIGAAFRASLGWAAEGRLRMVAYAEFHWPHWIGWALPVAVCAACGGVALWMTQRFAPRTAGSGIPRVEAVLRAHLRPAAGWILPVKFVGGTLSIGSGMALGREGPTVQMGGTVGWLVSKVLGKVLAEPWTMIAAGAGAGLAVAFDAPLAATIFVLEELLHRFSARVFSATLVACITGTVVLRALMGNATDFSVPMQALGVVPAVVLPEYLLLGLVAGFFGVLFNVAMLRTLRMFDRAAKWPRGCKGAAVGVGVGLLAWFFPICLGGGEGLAQVAINQRILWYELGLLLVVRFALTMGSYGCGVPRGLFAPTLALGALVGNVFPAIHLSHSLVQPAPFAIVAMAACFTAIVRSPLTGVVLLLEMTGGWTLILPMMAASLTAYVVPELLGNPPIYDSLRERDEMLERTRKAEGSPH